MKLILPSFLKKRISPKKMGRLFLDVGGSLLGLLCVILLLLLGRLAMGPIPLDFLTPDVEAELNMPQAGLKASVDHTQLVWRQWYRPFEIELINVILQKDDNPRWLTIEEVGVSFRLYRLLAGDLSLKQIRLYHPHLFFEKDKEGHFVFGLGNEGSAPEFSFEDLSALLALGSSIPSLGKLNELTRISIIDADILLKDAQEGHTWDLPKSTLVLRRETKGFRVDLTLHPLKNPGSLKLGAVYKTGASRIDGYANFHHISFRHLIEKDQLTLGPPNPDVFTIDALVNLLQQIDVPLNGKLHVAFDPMTLHIFDGSGNIDLGQGKLNLALTKGVSFPLTSGNIDFTLSPQALELKNLSLFSDAMRIDCVASLNSPTSPLSLTTRMIPDQTLAFQGEVKNLRLDQLGALWPQPVFSLAREWLTQNLRAGLLTQVEFSLKGHGSEDGFLIDDLRGSLKGEDAEITYLEGLPPAQNVDAMATFNQKGFDIKVLSGNIASLPLQEGHVVISDLDSDNETLALSVKSKGPISDFLQVLNHKPLEYASHAGIDPKKIKGEGTLELRITFPLLADLHFEDIKLEGKGKLQNVSLERQLTKDLKASLVNGNLSLQVTQDQMNIQGKGTLNNLPSTLTYMHSFDDSAADEVKIKVETKASFEDFKRLGFDSQEYGKGPTQTTLTYTLGRDHKSQLFVDLDTTPSTLSFTPLNWTKPSGVKSTLSFALLFEGEVLSKITQLNLQAPPYSLQGEVFFGPQQTWTKVSLSEFKGPHTHAQMTLQSLRENAYEVSFKGQGLDLEEFLKYMDKKGSVKNFPPTTINVSANVDQLRLGEGKTFQNVNASVELFLRGQETTWKAVRLRAQAGEGIAHKGDMAKISGGLSLDIKQGPDNSQLIEARANDGGKLLKNLDINDDIIGGYITIKAQKANNGPYKGTFKLKHFDANQVPLLARFAALLSPLGIVNLFSANQTLSMEQFECQFEFDENQIIVTQGVGKSLSLGFTVEGKINRKERLFNLKGNIIPARFLNSILNNIPIIGSLLTGGKGEGLIAIAYTVRGSFDAPDISLNPLSALAPGFIRNIFQSLGGGE